MSKLKDKYIDMVKSRVDIAQLVVDLSPGTVLKSSGPHRRKCCCVFHEERTPSLMLDLSLNCNKCFGCCKGGDIISFVQECQGLGFVDGVRWQMDTYCPDVNVQRVKDVCSTSSSQVAQIFINAKRKSDVTR